jgi:hypothetical protein
MREWRKDPVLFVRELFKAEPDLWQIDVLMACVDHQRIAMKACKGPGKSTVLAWVAWWFLVTRPYPKIAATSVTADNLSDGLWTEMAKWQNKNAFLKEAFVWQKTRIFSKDHPETWWMSARTWSKAADSQTQGETLAGLHADYLLFILDEAGGIPDAVMAAAEAGLATGKEMKLIMAGNPTHLEGPLYRACTKERNLWWLSEITGDPDDPKRAPRISEQWAREQIEKYGADNPWVMVNVFGKFPPGSMDSLLGVEEVNDALNRHLTEDQYSFAQKRLGIDVARFGDDRTVIYPRQGLAAFQPVVMRNARSNDVAARVALAKQRWQSEMEFVDDSGGYGSGVLDALHLAGQSPVPVSFSGKADDPMYLNRRAEMWFRMAEWIKKGGALPNDQDLARELTAPQYTFHGGKFKLEAKDHIKQRLGFSPDKADALALTFAIAEMQSDPFAAIAHLPGRRQQVSHDYDPFYDSR